MFPTEQQSLPRAGKANDVDDIQVQEPEKPAPLTLPRWPKGADSSAFKAFELGD